MSLHMELSSSKRVLPLISGIAILLLLVLSPFQAALADSSGEEELPSLVQSLDMDGSGGLPWENPEAAAQEDSKYAVTGNGDIMSTSQYLLATNFGFKLPASAKIQGIEVTIKRHAGKTGIPPIMPPVIIKPPIIIDPPIVTTAQPVAPELVVAPLGVYDDVVQLYRGELVGENKALTDISWPVKETSQIYGGLGDLWGEEWDPEQINSEKFGIALKVNLLGGQSANVDYISIRVYYQLPTITSVDCGKESIIYGDSLLCVATITSEDPQYVPVGSVTWTTNASGKFSAQSCELESKGDVAQCQVEYIPTKTGSHLITAKYESKNDIFLPSQDNREIQIQPRVLKISGLSAENKIYDGTNVAVISGTGVLEGVIYDDDVRLAGIPEGTFADKNVGENKLVTLSGVSLTGNDKDNYTLELPVLSASVTPRPLVIKAEDKTKKATQPDPVLTFNVTGLISGDSFLVEPICEVNGEHKLPGTYDIECRDADAGANYTTEYIKGSLTVLPSDTPLAIILSNDTITENSPIDSIVGRFRVVDPDSSVHTLSFCGSEDDINFRIDERTLRNAKVFDYETKNQYRICVRADDGLGGVLDEFFTIEVQDIPGVELLEPLAGDNLKYNRPLFDWEDFPGAISYQIQISNFARPILNKEVKSSEFTPSFSLPANTTLYWRVRARFNKTTFSDWSEVRVFKTAAYPPSSVGLIGPANNTLHYSDKAIPFSWKAAAVPKGSPYSMAYYKLEIASDPSFKNIVVEKRIEHDPAKRSYIELLPPNTLNPNTRYYWRVLSYNTAGEYNISALRQLRIAILAPTLLSPAHQSQVATLKPTFEWSNVEGASSYVLQISSDSSFKRLVGNYVIKTATSNFTLSKLLPSGRTLFWRVRAYGVNGPSLWSEQSSFSTP